MNDWWLSFYNDTFADFVFEKNQQTADDVKKIVQLLNLQDGARILDQCCGIGRLSVPLANKGYDVVGVDVIASYVQRANALKSNADFCVGDAFNFVTTPKCDAVFNWHTSFGYSLDDERNKMMLQCAYDSLKPGGIFALDYPNFAMVLRNFKPLLRQVTHSGSDSCTIERTSEIDLIKGVLKQNWVFSVPQKKSINRSGITRLYLPNQLSSMIKSIGFESIQLYGDIEGNTLELDSARCIALAKKPK